MSRPLGNLEKIANTVNPVYEDFWKQNDADILHRLNLAAQKMKDRRAEVKRDIPQEAHQSENPQSPSSECLAWISPVEQFPKENQETPSQEHLEGEVQKIPMEPLVRPPQIVNPIPISSLQMTPPDVLANFATRLNKVAKMKTGPVSNKAKLVGAMTTRPRVILQRLSPVHIKIHSATI